MSARIFISYRTTDGMDKATALARDLGRLFGDGAVFLDKDDLRGGSAWRDEIGATIGSKPVLLLLLTPQLLGATDAAGRPRIEAQDDPVRRELQAALDAGAHVVPVLCDGVTAETATLPGPFARLRDLTWRKLRAYDWPHDVARLVADIEALGIERIPPHTTPSPPTAAADAVAPSTSVLPTRRWLVVAAVGSGALLAAGAGMWWRRRQPAALTGRWQAQLWQGEQVVVEITQGAASKEGDPPTLTLASEPIRIGERPDWAEYRAFWRERFGAELEAVMYRGSGLLLRSPGTPPAIDVALQVLPAPNGREPVDGGNLSATLSADGRQLEGRIWLNGAQAEQPARLTRKP